MKLSALMCPVCQKALHQENMALKCASNHTYDISAKGYVNLLIDKYRNSQAPGDNRNMVSGRRRLLESGAYNLLCSAIHALLGQYGTQTRTMLDAGCGEGTWTLKAWETLCVHELQELYGLDISKEAIRQASGRCQAITWVVASSFHPPIRPHSMDLVMHAFAPASDEAFSAVLRRNGLLLTVIPGKEHLFGLKQVLYDDPYENDEALPSLPSFALLETIPCRGTLVLEGQQALQDLLTMTPYGWRSPKKGLERYAELTRLETPVSFVLALQQKKE